MTPAAGNGAPAIAPRRIRVRTETPGSGVLSFDRLFRIGRRDDAEVCIRNDFVSRLHAEVTCENGTWWVRDLESANGVFVNGQRVKTAQISQATAIRLGVEGPWVYFEPEIPPPPSDDVARAISRYFEAAGVSDGPVGEHTIVVRRAFAQVQQKQKRRHYGIVAALAVCIAAAAGYAWNLKRQVSQQTELALDLFYNMKSLDVDIAGLEKMVKDAGTSQGAEELRKYRDRRQAMDKNYDDFLKSLHVYDSKLTPQRRLIMRIARIFGESELAMPRQFVEEVENYIGLWKRSDRMQKAIRRAQENGYIEPIANELLAQGLPPQFFYLALQESDFDPYVSGPPTGSGIAKGMWQFVPRTAVQYGLKIGPLVELRRPDPADDRHHWDRATTAAAAYLKDLFRSEAQASGFLVMACYNWGEGRVLPLVRKMPANPKDRNFWRLLAMGKEKIPDETYKYVFYIASAAVIGEDPRLFGFDFDNPLGFLERKK